MLVTETQHFAGDGFPAEIGAAGEDDAGGLTTGVGVNDLKSLYLVRAHRATSRLGIFGRVRMPSWMIVKTASRSAPTSGRRGARMVSLPRPHSCTASLM